MLWKSPVYRFRIPASDSSESEKLKEIVIDVTGSAPGVLAPSEALKEVLNDIFQSGDLKKIDTVLEFGAAKLKNIPFLLKQGKTVCAVEFEKLTKNDFTKKNIKICEKYKSKFQKLLFPNPFLSDSKKFDLALLLNVPPVMPILAERLYLLDILHQKINKGKYLLWLAQKEGSYKKIREEGKNTCGDGLWMGKTNHLKTFYRHHPVEELDEIMGLFGFKLIKKFSVSDDARLYEKTDHNLFSGLISPRRIIENIPIDTSIKNPDSVIPKVVKKNPKVKEVVPNPKELSLENLYIEKIKSIPKGEYPEKYHRVVSHAISRIFRGSLRNMEIKQSINGGIKQIDTVFTNCADKGFFHNLAKKVECNYPMVEAKNISRDPTNQELDQLNGRLNKNRGHFGILVCRHISNDDSVNSRCKTYLPENYLLVLTDNDLFELLGYAREKNIDDINDFMDKKLKEILF